MPNETKGNINSGSTNDLVDAKEAPNSDSKSLSTSYDIFTKCIKRAENLISVESSTEEIDSISEQHYCDCYRAAVVLSISALDAFIRKTIISEIRNILSDSNQTLNGKLSDYIKNLLNQDKLLEAARNYDLMDRVEKAVKSDFETKSFQGEWKIENYLELVGHKDIFSKVAIEADINERNLRRKLAVFTNRRHIIAHSGDYDLNQVPHKEKPIDKKFADSCITTVSLFAKNIHIIVSADE